MAVKILLSEKNTLFETLVKKIAEYPELKRMLYSVLFTGEKISFNHDNDVIDLAFMLGFVKNENGMAVIANRLFETRLYNLFLSEEEMDSQIFSKGTMDKNQRQYIVEIKIWRGDEYNKRGERQLAEYLEAYHVNGVYLLSFNFNKKKVRGIKEVLVDGKRILEVVV